MKLTLRRGIISYDTRSLYGNFNETLPLREGGVVGTRSTGILRTTDRAYYPRGTSHLKGRFYGPNREEAAGTLVTDRIYGGWLVKKVGSFREL